LGVVFRYWEAETYSPALAFKDCLPYGSLFGARTRPDLPLYFRPDAFISHSRDTNENFMRRGSVLTRMRKFSPNHSVTHDVTMNVKMRETCAYASAGACPM
jgi:hypothetical protein